MIKEKEDEKRYNEWEGTKLKKKRDINEIRRKVKMKKKGIKMKKKILK